MDMDNQKQEMNYNNNYSITTITTTPETNYDEAETSKNAMILASSSSSPSNSSFFNSSTSPMLLYTEYSPELCKSVEVYVFNPVAIAGRSLQILLSFATFALLVRLIMAKRKSAGAKIFHGNFNILFKNLLLICLLYCFGALFLQLRYLVLYFFRTSPCNLLTPTWYSIVARLPGYLHLLALPMLHFAIMCERLRATLFSTFYEKEGISFSLMEMAIIWFISLVFSIFIVSSALSEFNMEMIWIYASLVSKYNSALVIVLQYVLLFLVLLTVGVDFWVVLHNRRQQKQKFNDSIRYNLSQKYQINENALSMRLMLPLDLSFATIFIIYLIISTIVRILMAQNALNMTTFEAIYDWLFCLNMQHGIISLWLYTRFIDQCRAKRQKRSNEVGPTAAAALFQLSNEADAHFRQLKTQWA